MCNSCGEDIALVTGKTKVLKGPLPTQTSVLNYTYQPDFKTWIASAVGKGAVLTTSELLTAHGNGHFSDLPPLALAKYAHQFEKVTGHKIGKIEDWAKGFAVPPPLPSSVPMPPDHKAPASKGYVWDGYSWIADQQPQTRAGFLIGSMEEALTMGTLKGARLMDAQELLQDYKHKSCLSEKALQYFCDLLLEGYGIQKWKSGTSNSLIPNFTQSTPSEIPLTMIVG